MRVCYKYILMEKKIL